jgi:dihydrodipicolinate synthase/N-acetylneuraminate lyase
MARYSRRQFLALGSAAVLNARAAGAGSSKPMRGAFIIMATPYTTAKAVDYEDLAGEVEFLHRCGVQGMVWPQMASEYASLTREERMQGMEVLAKASRGKKPALVLGVQADDKQGMLEYARHAEDLAPDAIIAMPPKNAASLDDYRDYYSALCELANRPVFIQTTGGAKGLEPSVEFIVGLARKFPNFGYVKEEYEPVVSRMRELAAYRPDPIKSVFSGNAGRGWSYELRLGFDGTMPGAMFADVYALLWELHLAGKREQFREVFSKLLMMINLDRQIPGVRNYMFKRRGVFKTAVSRRGDYTFSPQDIEEIEYNFAALKPYLRV